MDFLTQEEAKTLINSWLDQGLAEDLIQENLADHGFVEMVASQMLNEVKETRLANKPTEEVSAPVYDAPPPQPPVMLTDDPITTTGFFGRLALGEKRSLVNLVFLAILLIYTIKPSYIFLKKYAPLFQDTRSKIEKIITEVFPKDLEIKINKGLASTNVSEPYYINISRSTLDQLMPSSEDTTATNSDIRLLTIDTKGKAEDFERYQSLYLLTQNSLVSYSDGKINIQSLRNIQNLSVNRDYALSQVEKFNSFLALITGGFYFTPIFIFLANCLSMVMRVLYLSTVVWFITRVRSYQMKFAHIFRFVLFISSVYFLMEFITVNVPFLSVFSPAPISNIIIIAVTYSLLDRNQTIINT